MFKKTVALSSAFIAMSAGGSVHAEGFVDDAKASLALRNFYFNGDNRSHATNPRQEEWGQGFLLNLQSGFTQGTVGFGVDAVGMLGLRLDGGGKAGTNTSSRNPSANAGAGNLFPADSDNSPVSEYSSLGLTGKARQSRTEARLQESRIRHQERCIAKRGEHGHRPEPCDRQLHLATAVAH